MPMARAMALNQMGECVIAVAVAMMACHWRQVQDESGEPTLRSNNVFSLPVIVLVGVRRARLRY